MSIVQLQVYKFALKTNAGQSRELGRFAECCRFVWKKALALQMSRGECHFVGEDWLTKEDRC
jgi:hypothetical protein